MITLTGIKFNNEFRPTQDLNFLLACIGEKVTITLEFSFEDITYASVDNNILIEPDPATVDLLDTTGVFYAQDGVAFTDYRVGDKVGVWNGLVFTFYDLLVKYNNGLIKTSYTGSVYTYDGTNGEYVFNGTPFAGIRYAYNLIDSGSSFNSLIDGEYQQAEIATADTNNLVDQDMSFTGIESYQIGSVKIKGDGGVGGTAPNYAQQNFVITHETVITPTFLSDQYFDLIAGDKPSYFVAQNCLNFIAKLELCKDLNDPNGVLSFPVPVNISNVGWYGEKFNGGKSYYSISSVVIKKGVDVVNALEFDEDITVEITVSNTVESPFSNGNTKFVFGFDYLPEDEAQYQNNGRNLTKNFLFDSKMNTLGSPAVNGDNFGNGYQIIKTVGSTNISATSMLITAIIRVGSDAKAILQEGDNSRYKMWVITEKHSLAAALSNKVPLIAQVSEFELNLTNTSLVDGETKFITHPYTLVGDGESTLQMYPVDDVAANTKFNIDFTGLTSDGIIIKKIIPKLILTHATEADIVLEEFSCDVGDYPLASGLVQEIDFSQDRVFKIPSEIRKTITIVRDYGSDTGNKYYWVLNFPFMCRWEYWAALIVNNPPAGIFDPGEPLNGLNNFWHRLATVSGWSMKYIVNMQIEQNGILFEQDVTETTLLTSDFDGTSVWGNETIKSYDPDTNDELTNAGNAYLLGYKDTRIEAEFEKISGADPAVGDVVIVMWIETYESGGISGIRRISSAYELDSQSWFKSTDTSNKVVVTKTGSVYKGVCLVDYTKIPLNTQYSIYARLYDKTGSCSNIADNNGVCIQDNNNVDIEPN